MTGQDLAEHRPLLDRDRDGNRDRGIDIHGSLNVRGMDQESTRIGLKGVVAASVSRERNIDSRDRDEGSFRQGVMQHPTAVFWSLFFSLGVIMCSFDAQLLGNLYATPAFQRDFGYLYKDRYIIPASWQTGLSMGSPVGQAVGAFFAAYPMDWFGRKKTFGTCVVLTSACVAIQFAARSLRVLLVGELLGGLVLGTYVVIAPAYASEVCPTSLKGVLTGFTNLAFVLGQLLANCVIAGTSRLDTHWAYSIPFAVQWIWPAVILVGLPFAPESPWWLQRMDRLEEAEAALRKLASAKVDIAPILAQIIETDRLERQIESNSTYADCFKTTSLRRTEIGTGVYCIQVLSGIYLVSYATYFFQLSGIPTSRSFILSIIFLLLGALGTLTSFALIVKIPHRTIFLSGLVILSIFQYTIGSLDCVPNYTNHPALSYGQAILMLLWNFVYGCSLGPLTFVILTSVSSTRLRSKTIAFATAMQALLGVVMSVIIPIMFNPDQVDARGKIGFLFGGLATISWFWGAFRLPELKGRSAKEIDLLFEQRVRARDFKNYRIQEDLVHG